MNGESEEVEGQTRISKEEELARPSSSRERVDGIGGGDEGSSPKGETQPQETERGETTADPPPPTAPPVVIEQQVIENDDPEEEEEEERRIPLSFFLSFFRVCTNFDR